MAKINWTDSQLQAINAKGGSLIVSAAAGSGKTAVLVQRVISRITDKDNPIDADRILVVTYTRAAAAELKERLVSKLSELIKADPFNKTLLRQQKLMSKANISTIDSFCSSVVKEFFYVLNIERNFRIADESELALIKKDALKLTLDSMYAQKEPDFYHLVEAFASAKDDSMLENNILKIHEFLRSHPYPDLWIDEKLKMFSQIDSVKDSCWGEIVVDYAKDAAQFLMSLVDLSLDTISLDENLNTAFTPLLLQDRDFVVRLCDSFCYDTDKISDVIKSFDKGRIPTVKGYKEHPLKLKVEANRKIFKETIAKLESLFSYSEDESKADIADLFVVSQQLFNCVRQFSSNYQKMKAEKKIADYPDLEHWTIKLLFDEKTMAQTDIARKLQSRFDEIMVDEYQDANEAQDLIFSALSKKDENLFFVGDVKQSIYGFRQAMPQLFLNRKDKSSVYSDTNPTFPAKIFLDNNFRSAKPITEAVNFFFEKLMSQSVGDINYDETETLKYSASYDDQNGVDVSYHMLELDKEATKSSDEVEAEYIAQLIHRMVKDCYQVKTKDGYRDITYSDFAILMRNAKSHANIYAETLNRCMVPAFCENSFSFLNSHEIMVMTNLLSVIDNPALDIELLSVMMSPMFGFTADDMALIRCDSRYSSLYNAVMKKAQNGDEKCNRFIKELAYYRDVCVTVPVHTLINTIYERSGYLSVVSAIQENNNAVNNLLLLKEYAKDYEAGAQKGLSRFVSYLTRLRSNNSDIPGAVDMSGVNTNAVQIMSVHASKGLEFPVCILANTARKFVTDTNENVLLHSQLGVAVKKRDERTNVLSSTLPREALSLKLKRDEKSEELRVLYVAMTRAKQKLVMISSHEKIESYLCGIASKLTSEKRILPFVVQGAHLLSDWIAMCAMLHPGGELLRDVAMADIKADYTSSFELETKIVPTYDLETSQDKLTVQDLEPMDTDDAVINTLTNRAQFEYKNNAFAHLPSKVSASELSHKLSDKVFDRILDTPAFLNNTKLTAAQRGTALHAFMQFCDFGAAKIDLDSEIKRLTDNGFITQLQAQSIDREKAKLFVSSDIIDRAIKSDSVFKEYRFTIEVPPKLVDSSLAEVSTDETVLLQGAVDLAFLEDNELVIVDYKTDNVKDPTVLYEMYHSQLEIYKNAMQQCTDYKVKECLIYSVKHSFCINV